MLPLAQESNRPGCTGKRKQMEAADSLDRNNCAIAEIVDCHPHRRIPRCNGSSLAIPKLNVRTTHRACVRLRMKPAVRRIIVLLPAGRAHRESPHGRVRAIVREAFDDRVARPAMCAVDERVPETAIRGIPQFTEAIIAESDIGKDQHGLWTTVVARTDFKRCETGSIEIRRLAALDVRVGWMFALEPEEKALERVWRAFYFKEDTLRGVLHPTGKPEFPGQTEDKRAEAHSLNGSADDHMQTLVQRSGPRHKVRYDCYRLFNQCCCRGGKVFAKIAG